MAFDKEEYRELRERGIRGQGRSYKTKYISKYPCYSPEGYGSTTKPLSRYAVRKNTKRARKAAQKELTGATV